MGRLIVLWTIIDLHEEGLTFGETFNCIKADHYQVIEVSEDLKQAKFCERAN